jgi:large subunit ribosomal protein L15
MPLQRRVPKFGFKNPTRVEYQAVNVSALQALSEKLGRTEIGLDDIKFAGFAGTKELVKVLGNGEITSALTVTADAFSASAVSKIEAAGGKAIVIGK